MSTLLGTTVLLDFSYLALIFFFNILVSNTYLLGNNPAVSNMLSVFTVSIMRQIYVRFNFSFTVKITAFCHFRAILYISLVKKSLALRI